MVVSSTPSISEKNIVLTIGPVFGEVVAGISFGKDFVAGFNRVFGGRSSEYENEIIKARENAIQEMKERAVALGANAIVGFKVDYENMGQDTMLMIIASGTAVIVE